MYRYTILSYRSFQRRIVSNQFNKYWSILKDKKIKYFFLFWFLLINYFCVFSRNPTEDSLIDRWVCLQCCFYQFWHNTLCLFENWPICQNLFNIIIMSNQNEMIYLFENVHFFLKDVYREYHNLQEIVHTVFNLLFWRFLG